MPALWHGLRLRSRRQLLVQDAAPPGDAGWGRFVLVPRLPCPRPGCGRARRPELVLDGMSAPALARGLRRHDRDRYQLALFAPAERRDALFALYAFNYEVARVREAVTQPMLGQIRLQWWREVVDAAYAGTSARRHEVVQPLVAAIAECGLSRTHFDRIIDTRERDLADASPADLAVLEYRPPTPIHDDNLAGHWMYGLSARMVRDVYVAGVPVVLDRRLTRVDDGELSDRTAREAARLWARMEEIDVHPFDPATSWG